MVLNNFINFTLQFLLTDKAVMPREYESVEIVRCTDQPLALEVVVHPAQDMRNFVQFGLLLADNRYTTPKEVSLFFSKSVNYTVLSWCQFAKYAGGTNYYEFLKKIYNKCITANTEWVMGDRSYKFQYHSSTIAMVNILSWFQTNNTYTELFVTLIICLA